MIRLLLLVPLAAATLSSGAKTFSRLSSPTQFSRGPAAKAGLRLSSISKKPLRYESRANQNSLRLKAVVERNAAAANVNLDVEAPKTSASEVKEGWIRTVELDYPILLVSSEGVILSERAVARSLGAAYPKMVREVRYLQGRGLVVDFRSDEFRSLCLREWAQPEALSIGRVELYKMEGGGLMPATVAKALAASRCHEKTKEFLVETDREELDYDQLGAPAQSFIKYSFPLILESDSYVEDAVEQVQMSMGREFETLVKRCQWMQGRGLVLDFKINAARNRWATFWAQRPVGFERRALSVKRFYRYPIIIESKFITGDNPVLTPGELKSRVQKMMGDDWGKLLTRNTHFFHNKDTGDARGIILDFKKPGSRELWRSKISQRAKTFRMPINIRDFKWYTDDDGQEKMQRRQESLNRPGAVESMPTTRIFVGNLNKTASAVDLVIHFSQFGPVKDATVMASKKTGKSRGFGFVTFKNEKTTEKVMGQYHRLMGHNLAVQKALKEEDIAIRGEVPSAQMSKSVSTPTRTIRVNFPQGASKELLQSYFAKFGTVGGLDMAAGSEEAHVHFVSPKAVEKVVSKVKHSIEILSDDGEPVLRSLYPEKEVEAEADATLRPVLTVAGSDVDRVLLESKGAAKQQVAATSTTSSVAPPPSAAKDFFDDMDTMVRPVEDSTSEADGQQQQQQQQQQGQMPADFNIDLFGVKKDPEMLRRMRLAEVKHGRLAMLAAAAWPLQELFDPALANLLKVAPLLTQDGRNPDVLNGGDLQQISPLFWSSILGATITLELLYGERGLKGEIRIENADMIARGEAGRPVFTEVSPGDLGFDPLMLYPDDRPGQLRAQAGEINNGRLAMIALVTFVLSEYFTGKSIVELTPQFFTPIGQ